MCKRHFVLGKGSKLKHWATSQVTAKPQFLPEKVVWRYQIQILKCSHCTSSRSLTSGPWLPALNWLDALHARPDGSFSKEQWSWGNQAICKCDVSQDHHHVRTLYTLIVSMHLMITKAKKIRISHKRFVHVAQAQISCYCSKLAAKWTVFSAYAECLKPSSAFSFPFFCTLTMSMPACDSITRYH